VALSGAAIGGASAVLVNQGLGGWQVTIEFRGLGMLGDVRRRPDGSPPPPRGHRRSLASAC
jgi:hypothetical protein